MPLLFWFLILVTGFAITVVKMRLSLFTSSFFFFAIVGETKRAAMAKIMSFLIVDVVLDMFIIICFFLSYVIPV